MTTTTDRWKGAAGAAILQGLMLYGLFLSTPAIVPPSAPALLYISPISPERVEPPAIPRRAARHRPSGKAAPPNRTAKPVPVVTPPPVIPFVAPPPPVITAAPVAAEGARSTAGATPRDGPGTGAGGTGNGLGSGDSGEGVGDDGTWAVWKKGRIHDRDYPAAAFRSGTQGSLRTRYTIGTNGRVTKCEVLETSGSKVLDETTCRLVMQRYRYKPARDAAGRAVVDIVTERHHWELEPPFAPPAEAPPQP